MCLQQKMVIIPKSSKKITQLDMGSLFGYIRLEKKFHVLLEKAELTCSQNGYFGVSGHISGVFGLSIGCPNICPEYSEYLGYRLDVRTYVYPEYSGWRAEPDVFFSFQFKLLSPNYHIINIIISKWGQKILKIELTIYFWSISLP